MADKKITALNALNATGKDSAVDLLHIIDFSGSPVNKKITVADLFSNVNTDTHIYGNSKVFEVGQAASVNSHIRVAVGGNATTDGAVTINDDGVAYVDFLVKSLNSDGAIKVDAGTDDISINSDGNAAADFHVHGGTKELITTDGGEDWVGIGATTPATAYTLTVGATGTNGIQSLGSVHVTGEITASTNASITGDLTVTSRLFFNDAIATALVGGANVGAKVAIPVTDLVAHLDPGSSTGHYGLANGTSAGQVKIIYNADAAEVATITPTTLAHVGNTLTLQAGETATMLYTTGGWIMLNYGGAVTQV